MHPLGSDAEALAKIERAKLLWEEYRYRHDLIWSLLFRITAVATLLCLAPFLIEDDVAIKVGRWIALPPVLGLVVLVASPVLLTAEFRHFDRVVAAFYRAQEEAVKSLRRPTTGELSPFKLFVFTYIGVLCALAVLVMVLVLTRLGELSSPVS
jgi:hypothetical protein